MKKIMISVLVLVGAAGLTLTPSCKSSDDDHDHSTDGGHVSSYPSCQAIIDKCHPLDLGDPGPIHDCHELAHDATDDATCAAKKAECEKTCVPGAADSGGQDAPTGG